MFQILFIFAGTLCAVLGAFLWFKKRVDFLRPYHLRKVSDAEAFCVYAGRIIMAFGASVIVIAFVSLLHIFSDIFWSLLMLGITLGAVYLLSVGQNKY